MPETDNKKLPETNVRLANYDDLPELLDMSKKFFDATPYKDIDTFDVQETANTLRTLLSLQPLGKALLLVSIRDNKAVGMLLAQAGKALWSSSVQVAEVAWYVSDEDRKSGMGKQLIEGYDYWTKMVNGKIQSMAVLTDLDPGDTLFNYLKGEGYKEAETALVRGVN